MRKRIGAHKSAIFMKNHLSGDRLDVTGCIIFISNQVEYLHKEHSYKNSTKGVIFYFK